VNRLPARRSSAALRALARGETSRTIAFALLANVTIAAAKLLAGLLSGSVALLAEGGHSIADSINEVFLALSLVRGNVPADVLHPLGHGRERFLWAFMAAISSFLIGGCVSIGLAVWALLRGGSDLNVGVAWLVLVVSIAADGLSLRQSIRQARREAQEHALPLLAYVRQSSDPALRAVLVEDTAALVGVGLAACGLLASELLGNSVPDAVASFLIGVLLATTAFGLARPVADLLVGRSLPPEQMQRILEILSAESAIEEVLMLQAVYTGPREVIVAAKVHPTCGLTVDQLARAMDGVDHALRAALPEVADLFLDVTSLRRDNLADHPMQIGLAPSSPAVPARLRSVRRLLDCATLEPGRGHIAFRGDVS
jgi:cation diffusion facilitator family transporter